MNGKKVEYDGTVLRVSHVDQLKELTSEDLEGVLFITLEDDPNEMLDLIAQSKVEELEEDIRRSAIISTFCISEVMEEYKLNTKTKSLPFQFTNKRKGKKRRW